MKNVLYVTWGENIVDSGLYNTQVLSQLCKISAVYKGNVRVLAGIPIGKKYLIENSSYKNKVASIIKAYGVRNIEMYVRKIPVISGNLQCPWWAVLFYHLPHLFFFRRLVVATKSDIVHCRSYQATILALLSRKLFGLNYKVVFDTRGLVPEEGVFIKAYSKSSLSYRFWKYLERKLLEESDAIVNVSETFTEHIKALTNNKNVHTLLTSVNTKTFIVDRNIKQNIRQTLGISPSEKVLVYCGHLGEKSWHDTKFLGELYMNFKRTFRRSRLLIVTRADKNVIYSELAEWCLTAPEVKICSAETPEEVNSFLLAGDYGALPFRAIKSEIERLISYTMIATKTGEYLACGLPVIVNENIGGAKRLVENNNVGFSFSPENDGLFDENFLAIETHYSLVSEKCRQVAEHFFSVDVNAKKYIDIYDAITKNT